MNFRRAIDVACAARGMAKKDLAERMGVDEAALSRLGRIGNPTIKTLERAAKALEIPLFLLVLLASDAAELGSAPPELGAQILATLTGMSGAKLDGQ